MSDSDWTRWAAAAVVAGLVVASGVSAPAEEQTGEPEVETDPTEGEPEEAGEQMEWPDEGYWWGQIQKRADVAYEHLEEEIDACLGELGGEERTREIGLEAVRDDDPTSQYELVEATAHPGSADDHPCVRKVAAEYVEAVDSAFWDDFERYVATFVGRGGEVGPSDCDEELVDGECVGLDVEWGQEGAEAGDGRACPEPMVETVEQILREQRDCRMASMFGERLDEYGDDPLRTRAVMTSELIVEEGKPVVVLRHNRPWVEPMVGCMAEELEQRRVQLEVAGASACRSALSNWGVTLWFGPSFNYVVGD